MAENLVCTCKTLVAVDRINDAKSFLNYCIEEMPERLHPTEKRIFQDLINSVIHALDDASQTCNLKLEDVKAEVNLANLTFQNQKWFTALDHITDAKVKLKTKVCATGV